MKVHYAKSIHHSPLCGATGSVNAAVSHVTCKRCTEKLNKKESRRAA